ncbi:Dipeptidyl aminopeptidase/acylaminoacyl peptidase [Chryseobacterium sp. OV279]|nr:Dipeptidyl aminopeptidase/acylaminoacyl peptidase [Chryseobacterium sp. OV279]
MNRIQEKLMLILLMGLTTTQLLFGQKTETNNNLKKDKDTLEVWMSKFYTITNLKASPNDRYVLVGKTYKRNNDTVLVFDTEKSNQPIHTLVKKSNILFFDDDKLLTSGDGKAELLNLKTDQKKSYENVQRAETLDKSGHYFILNKDKTLSLYDKNSKFINSVSGVSQYTTDKKSKIFIAEKEENKQTKENTSFVSVILNDNTRSKEKNSNKETLYSTENEITKLELAPSGKYLIVTEKIQNSDHLQVTFIPANAPANESMSTNQRNPDTKRAFKSFSGKADFVTITEIGNGKSYFIDFDKRIPPAQQEMVEVWYGTDKNLRKKKYGTQEHEYQIWNTETNHLEKLPTNKFSTFAAMGSSRYFLAFNTEEEFNYVNTSLVFPIDLYDITIKSYRPLFTASSKVTGTKDGTYIVGFEENQGDWVLYDLTSFAKNLPSLIFITEKGFKNPVFSSDSRFLFFESDNGLWQYDLKSQKMNPVGIAKGKEVKIMDKKIQSAYTQYNARFELSTIDLQKPMLLKVRDKKNNLTSYINWRRGKTEILIPPTQNRIKDVKYSENKSPIFSIEENYNSPPLLYRYETQFKNKENRKTAIFKSGKEDKVIINLKQEILSYTNMAGTKLKGILYYPIGFNPNQKYPMVVRVYQQQAESSGVYPVPDYDEDGFNVRLLLEHGYFVFLPDIIYDERGTGIAALDCVNSGLDQLQAHPNIDQKRIGLTGHSMGGYETNFIATKSNQFAAYVSGASVNNIVKFYFSYNAHFNLFDFSRFENGQHEMNVSFSEDKEKYFKNNPIDDVEKVSAPMLLWTGLKDENVTPDQTMAFYTGLLRNRKPVIALLYPNKEHDLGRGSKESEDLNLKTLEWWGYFLKDEKNVPWIDKEMMKYQNN